LPAAARPDAAAALALATEGATDITAAILEDDRLCRWTFDYVQANRTKVTTQL
jgi:hypothetical protein